LASVSEGYFKVKKGWSTTKAEYLSFKRSFLAYVKSDVQVVLHNMNKGKDITSLQEVITVGDKVLNIVCYGYHTRNLSRVYDLNLGNEKFIENTQTYICADSENEIVFKHNDIPMASYQIDRNIIWLLWDASNAANNNILKANFALIKKCLEFFKEKTNTGIFKQVVQMPTNLKIDGLRHFNEAELNNKRARIQSLDRELEYALTNVAQKNRDRNLVMQEIANLENQKFDEITIVNKYVKHIETNGSVINVYTDNIFAKEFERQHFERLEKSFVEKVNSKNVDLSNCGWYIGQFKITIDMRSFNIKFYNLNNRRSGFWGGDNMHPHISSAGVACLGNLTEMIAFATSEAKLDILIDVLIQYLQSVNLLDSAGNKVVNWDFINLKTNTYVLTGDEFVLPRVDVMFREE